MSQLRNRTGISFEKDICKKYGWTHVSKCDPKIYWSGNGRFNFDKIKSTNLDPNKFYPIYEKSNFDKYDAIGKNGEKIEIKKYLKEECYSWKMLSEPIFKIANRSQIPKVISMFKAKDLEEANEKYNDFLDGVYKNIGSELLYRITSSFDKIQLIDDYINKDDLEFKWEIKKGWSGFNRLTIMFRIKENQPTNK